MTRPNYNLIRLVKTCIYQMKREYGGEITLYQLTTAVTDRATGVKTETHNSIVIPRAVVLPARVQREVIQSISAISANKKLVMGGSFDAGTRVFIVDRLDAPGYIVTNDDWIVYKHVRYNIKSVEEFEQNTAWVITDKTVEGVTPEEDIRVYGTHDLYSLTQNAVGVTAQHTPRIYLSNTLTFSQEGEYNPIVRNNVLVFSQSVTGVSAP